eukprot:3386706-Amphidinium_carterae.1
MASLGLPVASGICGRDPMISIHSLQAATEIRCCSTTCFRLSPALMKLLLGDFDGDTVLLLNI